MSLITGAVLICTENRLSSKRLNQMCDYLKSKYTDESIRRKNFFDNIFVEFVPDSVSTNENNN